MEALDFSRFTELAERHREQENHGQVAAIYRASVEGIDENVNLVAAAYDHYAQTFRSALGDDVECTSQGDIGSEKCREHVGFLSERAATGTDYLRVPSASEEREE